MALTKAEMAEREVRSIAYQIKAARFPAYKDQAGFDFASSEVNEALVRQLLGKSALTLRATKHHTNAVSEGMVATAARLNPRGYVSELDLRRREEAMLEHRQNLDPLGQQRVRPDHDPGRPGGGGTDPGRPLMAALIIGTLLALAALAYVLYPLFVEPRSEAGPSGHPADEPSARVQAAEGGVPDDPVEAEIRRAADEKSRPRSSTSC